MVSELLKKIIVHAYNTVPYYKKLFDINNINLTSLTTNNFESIPILNKDHIQDNYDMFLSETYKTYPENKYITIKRTSGSSGKYLKVLWSKKDEVRSLFQLALARKKYYSIEPYDKYCSFYTTLYRNNKLCKESEKCINYSDKNLVFSKLHMEEENLNCYYNEMIKFQPKWVFIQPSIALLFADYINSNKLQVPKSLKYVEYTGEYLFESLRNEIEYTFCNNTANMYGCNEVNGIAYECNYGRMHVLSNNVFVEILKDGVPVHEGEEGDIYITGLTNYAMPFIRYNIGDRGRLFNRFRCNCGNKEPVLELVSGRISEYISLENGKKMNCYVVLKAIEEVNEHMGSPIRQFKIIQKDLTNFKTYFVLKLSFYGWEDSIRDYFLQQISKLNIGKIIWKIEFVDRIIYPEKQTGKFNFFKNEITTKEG